MPTTTRDRVAELEKKNAELARQLEACRADLKEALAQQTAAAEVLQVINSSPGDLAPVFDAMLEKAMRLCEASFGFLTKIEGKDFRAVALRGASPAFAEFFRQPQHIVAGQAHYQLMQGANLVHVEDFAAESVHHSGDPALRALADLAEARTGLCVALRSESTLLGAIVLYRKEVRRFSDKQIALLQNFAAQAVIAMENARLLTETREALEQQTATAEVLQVINSSPGELQPVFDAMLEKAVGLCDAAHGVLRTFDGEFFLLAAMRGEPDAVEALKQLGAIDLASIRADDMLGAIVRGQAVVHITDVRETATYRDNLAARERAESANQRSWLAVALRKDGALLGVIMIYRTVVRPFTDKQIILLQNFAAQAVIAMENARLLTETREALEQQTATAEVLQVINSSPGDLAPVFEAMLEKATRLCGASLGTLWEYDGELMHPLAMRGVSPEYAEYVSHEPLRPGAGALGSFVRGETILHVLDLKDTEAYRNGDTHRRALVDLGGGRTLLGVPLRTDDQLRGAFLIYRREPQPFTEKEIALLENFAAQAVIAMENARLLTETREALDQQTATAEVLQVINSSPGDLAPVFQAMLHKAHTLCEASFGALMTYDGERFHAVAHQGTPAPFREFLAPGIRPGPGDPFGRMVEGAALSHIHDLAEVAAQHPGEALPRAAVGLGGIRTLLVVPLRKDDALLGAITAYRREVRPFTEKQIVLLQNFAAQAVIAMENARLLGELRQRTGDLQESLVYQTAVSDVLKVISRSTFDLDAVLQAVVTTAIRLCRADQAVLYRNVGGEYRWAAGASLVPEYESIERETRIRPGGGTLVGRVGLERGTVHILDAWTDPLYEAKEDARIGGVHTMLGVPLLRDGETIGVIGLARRRVEAYSDKEIELVRTFADQAVIAIENARLITETREALQQQTATAEVLQVVNSSPGDLAPVFDAMLERSLTLCEASFGFLNIYDGTKFSPAAQLGVPEPLAAYFRTGMDQPQSGDAHWQLVAGEDLIHNLDQKDEEAYRSGNPLRRATVDLGGARSALVVALRKEDRLLGGLTIYRQEVRPFTDKQIALLQNFAAQAVIAIENARLITETRAARDAAERALAELKTAQANLVHAEKMASLGQLTAGIAHEIKNPLNFVNNFAGLSVELLDELKEAAAPALRTLDSETGAEIDEIVATLTGNLERIAEHGRRADGIVKSMLDHSRGGGSERRRVDLNALVEEALNLAYHGARAQDHEFTVALERDFDPAAAPIELVPQDMTRVLLNLFANGFYAADQRRRAAADGGFRPALEVATRDLGDAVEIRVRDNGIGIAPEHRDRLFQPFFTTKPTGEGTGLGLSISWDIVTQEHGGAIAVDSAPGEFTEFTIRLPRLPGSGRPATFPPAGSAAR